MMPLMHRRGTRTAIARLAIATVLGILIFTPKMDGDRIDLNQAHLAPQTLPAAASPGMLVAEQQQ